ncbi:MAG: O-antigen ligase family protein [Bacteroidota bacterium]
MLTIATGLSLGAIFISLGIIIVTANWFLEGNFNYKFQQLKSCKLLWVFLAFYLMHVLAMLWSDDIEFGCKDLKIKLPLLGLPIVFASTPKLKKNEFETLMKFYLAGIISASLWSMAFYMGWKETDLNDIRGISRFFSHIRFSLNIVFGIFISAWFLVGQNKIIEKLIFILSGIWLIIFLFILSSLTGIILLIMISIIFTFYFTFKQKNRNKKILFSISILIITLLPSIYLYEVYNNFFPETEHKNSKLEKLTPSGDLYFHDKDLSRENGYFVWRNICYPELEKSWNKKSKMDFEGLDKKGNSLKFTIIRYITSLGLKKDSLGFSKLKLDDIANIESGIPNFKLANASSLDKRIYEMLWEVNDFFENGHLKNHSLMVRAIYWKTAIDIIKSSPIFGAGTGDIQKEFEKRYSQGNVLEKKEDMRRSHNQYLEIWASLGIFGLILLVIISTNTIFNWKKYHPLSLPISLILVLSMLTEDTLETQAGVSMYALFIKMLIFSVPQESSTETNY